MCGICGIVEKDPNQRVDKEMILSMMEVIHYRGPDSQGSYLGKGIGLGVRRLSIIDLKTGDQPITNEDGMIVVVCNGEIYNFCELRTMLLSKGHHFKTNSDVEVIVHLYEEFNTGFLEYLRGMFALALWDGYRRRLILARDRFGIKPLYYADTDRNMYFASEIKAILINNQIERHTDAQAVGYLFRLACNVGSRTLIKKVRSVLPAHFILYEKGSFSNHGYWNPVFDNDSAYNNYKKSDDWAEDLVEQLKDSIKLHIRSDVEVGATLSGGIDSSSVVSLMRKYFDKPIKTFSVTFEDSRFDEITRHVTLDDYPEYSIEPYRIVCKKEDFRLYPYAIWHCESPSTAGVEIPRMLLHRICSEHVKVVMTGEGSDEVLGGYQWYQTDKILKPFSYLPMMVRKLIAKFPFFYRNWPGAMQILLSPKVMNFERYQCLIGPARALQFYDQIFSKDFQRFLKDSDEQELILMPPENFYEWDRFNQLQYYDMNFRLPGCIIHQLDRTSMAYSLEARVPFLDHKLVEFCMQIPVQLKMKRLNEKYILRRAMKDILPREIVKRKKYAMTAPQHQWLRGDVPEFVHDLLSFDTLKRKGYFNSEFVTKIFELHKQCKGNYGGLLLLILGMQVWDEIFIQGKRPE